MKHIWQRDIVKVWEDMAPYLQFLEENHEYFESALWYTIRKVEEKDYPRLQKIFDENLKTKNKNVMGSIVEKWYNDGKSAGIQQGIQEGKAEENVRLKIEIAKNLMKQGLDISLISSATGLSRLEIENLQFHVQKLAKKD